MTPDPGSTGENFLVSTNIEIRKHSTMNEFIRNTLSRQKLQQLCVNTAFGNFVGYVAGSFVMVFTTYRSVERRALKNLFGILPRHEVVVHRCPSGSNGLWPFSLAISSWSLCGTSLEAGACTAGIFRTWRSHLEKTSCKTSLTLSLPFSSRP